MRRFVPVVLLVCGTLTAGAQSPTPDVQALQTRIDSLQHVRDGLQTALLDVDGQLERLRAEQRRIEFEQLESADVVLQTNMDASMRSLPSPASRVVQLVPAGTPLAAIDFEGAYWKVRFEGREGWIMRVFVDEGPTADAFKKLIAERGRLTTDESEMHWDWRAEAEGKPLLITSFGVHPPNSAGGIAAYYTVAQIDSSSVIRDITLHVTPYDASGKKQTSHSGVSTRPLRRFGPISAGERQFDFENVWYNEAIQCIVVDRIDVTYTNGRYASYSRNVDDVLSSRVDNDCAVTAAHVE
ncbi:MAG: hypothetical protein R2834_17490 [Rhodothermales bacterium]